MNHGADHIAIQNLKRDIADYQISIEVIGAWPERDGYKEITLNISGKSYRMFVDDEYDDLIPENQPLCWCVVLRNLEIYQDGEDFLQWCRFTGLEVASSAALMYYRDLDEIYTKVWGTVGEIDSQIQPLEFELNSNAAYYLRQLHKR